MPLDRVAEATNPRKLPELRAFRAMAMPLFQLVVCALQECQPLGGKQPRIHPESRIPQKDQELTFVGLIPARLRVLNHIQSYNFKKRQIHKAIQHASLLGFPSCPCLPTSPSPSLRGYDISRLAKRRSKKKRTKFAHWICSSRHSCRRASLVVPVEKLENHLTTWSTSPTQSLGQPQSRKDKVTTRGEHVKPGVATMFFTCLKLRWLRQGNSNFSIPACLV